MNRDRLIRQRACEAKHDYETEMNAQHVAKLRRKQTGENIRPYRCRFCSGWHIGHATGSTKGQPGIARRKP